MPDIPMMGLQQRLAGAAHRWRESAARPGWLTVHGSEDASWLVEPMALVEALASAPERFYQSCAGFDAFGKGWISRVEARRAAAMAVIQLL